MIKTDLSISVTGNFSGDMWSDNCYEQCYVHIFNTFSVLFYSKHAYVNRTKKTTVSHVHSFMHAMNTF